MQSLPHAEPPVVLTAQPWSAEWGRRPPGSFSGMEARSAELAGRFPAGRVHVRRASHSAGVAPRGPASRRSRSPTRAGLSSPFLCPSPTSRCDERVLPAPSLPFRRFLTRRRRCFAVTVQRRSCSAAGPGGARGWLFPPPGSE